MSFAIVDDETQRMAQLKEVAIEFASSVVGVEAEDLAVSILSGGITNQLYRVKNTKSGKSVVVRVFGKETERIISRDAELFWQSMFIHTFGRKGNALVYEFLDGFKDLDFLEMPKLSEQIAANMARFHVKATTAGMAQLPYATEENFTLEALTKWLDLALCEETYNRLSKEKQAQFDSMSLKSQARDEAKNLLEAVKRIQHKLPQGTCHNDLLSANIMLRREGEGAGKEMKLIDFEYAKKNFLYYDIGNTFNEYTGLDCEWDKYFPDETQMKKYVRAYLVELRAVTQPSVKPLEEAELEEQVASVTDIVCFFTGVSNVCWSFWAVIQQAYSVIDFDYLSYGQMRWQRHLDTKEAFALKE